MNLWCCEICPKKYTTVEEVGMWSDPVVALPPEEGEWGYKIIDGKEKFACPNCKDTSPPTNLDEILDNVRMR